jgi:hypothetical protein
VLENLAHVMSLDTSDTGLTPASDLPVVVDGGQAHAANGAELVALMRQGVLTNGDVDAQSVRDIVASFSERANQPDADQHRSMRLLQSDVSVQVHELIQLLPKAVSAAGVQKLLSHGGFQTIDDLEDAFRQRVLRLVASKLLADLRLKEAGRLIDRSLLVELVNFFKERSKQPSAEDMSAKK